MSNICDSVATNAQKYENYREQFTRLKKALDSKFFLEAIFIEYTIIEDRTESILRHAGKWEAYIKKRGGREATLNSKVTYINGQVASGDKLLKKYFSDNLLSNILEWKEMRNQLIHALLKQNLTTEYLADIAYQGSELTKMLRNRTNSFINTLMFISKKARIHILTAPATPWSRIKATKLTRAAARGYLFHPDVYKNVDFELIRYISLQKKELLQEIFAKDMEHVLDVYVKHGHIKSLFTCLYYTTGQKKKQYFFVNLFLERLNP